MPRLIDRPSRVDTVAAPPARIDEFAGRVNSGGAHLSVARMRSPGGWTEPALP